MKNLTVFALILGCYYSNHSIAKEQNLYSILNVDFQKTPLGLYSEQQVADDFGVKLPWSDGLKAERATILVETSNRFMRVNYPAGGVGPSQGGVQFLVPFQKNYNELFLSYRVRFGKNFEFVKGGKLPGLVGGKHPTGCKPNVDGFSARNMWRPEGGLVQYIYWPKQPHICGDDLIYQNQNRKMRLIPERWYTITHHIKMNDLSKNNGELQSWVDGELMLNDSSRVWRLENANFGIDGFYFSTFFGGNDESWAPKANQTIDFDDIVISEKPIEK